MTGATGTLSGWPSSTSCAMPTPATRRPGRRRRGPAAVGQGREAGRSARAVPRRGRVRAGRDHHLAEAAGAADRRDRRRGASGMPVLDRRPAGRRPRARTTLEAILRDAGDPDATGPRRPRPGLQRARRRADGVVASSTMQKGAMARIDIDRPLAAGAGTLRLARPAGPAQARAAEPPRQPASVIARSGRSRNGGRCAAQVRERQDVVVELDAERLGHEPASRLDPRPGLRVAGGERRAQ